MISYAFEKGHLCLICILLHRLVISYLLPRWHKTAQIKLNGISQQSNCTLWDEKFLS